MRSTLIIFSIALSLIFFSPPDGAGAVNVDVTAIVPGCGDGFIGSGEECDGLNLSGASCLSRGFGSGLLSCTSACTFNTLECTLGPGIGSGGGGSRRKLSSIPSTNMIFTGKAYPKSTVTLLKDSQIVATSIADVSADFQVAVSGISSGHYIFGVYAEDNIGQRSTLLTFPYDVAPGLTVKLSDILIPPSISVNKNEVRHGDSILIFGQSVPYADITISIKSVQESILKTTADQNGNYLYNFNTGALTTGEYFVKSHFELEGGMSSFNDPISFTIGAVNIASITSSSTLVNALIPALAPHILDVISGPFTAREWNAISIIVSVIPLEILLIMILIFVYRRIRRSLILKSKVKAK